MTLNTLRKVCTSNCPSPTSQYNSDQEMIANQELRSTPINIKKTRRFSLPPRVELTNAEPLFVRCIILIPKMKMNKGSKKLDLLARSAMRRSLTSSADSSTSKMKEVIAK